MVCDIYTKLLFSWYHIRLANTRRFKFTDLADTKLAQGRF